MQIKKVLILLTIFISINAIGSDKVVNIFNWSDYLPNQVIQEFEKQTGIKVNYTEYDDNDELYAKMKSDPNAEYDIIVPSSYMVQRMIRQNMLMKLDKTKIPNLKYLNPKLLYHRFDPNNNYSIPYLWGTTGIVVNSRYFNPKTISRWQDFWRPQYKNQLLIYNEAREAFGITLLTLGYSFNDTDPNHIKAAYEKLRKLLPNIKLFNSSAVNNIYIDEDALIGMAWSGDAYNAKRVNPALHYIFPKDGVPIWIDCIAIPKYAPHLNNAYKFINFILQPKIAAQIAQPLGYSTPEPTAYQYLPKAMQKSPILNPSDKILKNSYIEEDVGNANTLYEKYWELLKLGT